MATQNQKTIISECSSYQANFVENVVGDGKYLDVSEVSSPFPMTPALIKAKYRGK